jgi:hypothetical protein
VKFSAYNKYRGGFDYYDVQDFVGINDDHPTPQLSKLRTKVGVPATLAARPLPKKARYVGHGDIPIGSITSGKVGNWTKILGGNVPSGMGSIPDFICPKPLTGGIIGAILGALANDLMTDDDESTDIPRGLKMAVVGGLTGGLIAAIICRGD